MLERYYVRPETIDRIRSAWIGPLVDQYVTWMVERGYSTRNLAKRVPLLLNFGAFARREGATDYAQLPGYDAVLAPLGGARVMEFNGVVIGYGVGGRPTFWLGPLTTGEPNREIHVAFQAASREAVQTFFDAAVAAGAAVLHEPRLWPEYHPNYFGGFVRDPDGNNVEAVSHVASG